LEPLRGDTPAALDWLARWEPAGPWVVVAIEPTKAKEQRAKTEARVFYPGQETTAAAFIDGWQGIWNLYFSANRADPSIRTSPTKEQITHVISHYVDLDLPGTQDPEQEASLLARLRSLEPPPPLIIFSGGGFQGFWRLDAPTPLSEYGDRAESVNKAIQRNVGADSVQNHNRLMRLPGTINVPNVVKVAKGRRPMLARVVDADWETTFSLDRDPVPHYPDDGSLPPPDEPAFGDNAHTLEGLDAKLRKLIKSGDASEHSNDRSKMLWYVICMLIRRGWNDDEIYPFLTDSAYGLSQHVRDQGNPASYANRQLRKARDAVDKDWLRNPKSGAVLKDNPTNIERALTQMGVRVTYDMFVGRDKLNGAGPLRLVSDRENVFLAHEINRRFGFLPTIPAFNETIIDIGQRNSYHPVLDYLKSLSWDGVPRIEKWLIDHGDVADTELNRAISRLMLVAAVRRVRHPGCKFDEMLVLVDPTQGTDKSSLLAALCPRREWFSDSVHLGSRDREAIEEMAGRWIIEVSELEGIGKRDVEAVKKFLSKTVDSGRMAYGHFTIDWPRQCVIFGTTNVETFLRDSTGNRRFWPVVVRKRFNVAGLIAIRDQLWAEAAHYETLGESIRLDESLWVAAAEVQEFHRIEEPWASTINRQLKDRVGKIFTDDIWTIIDKPNERRLQTDNARLGEVMREIGWERKVLRLHGAPTRCYVKGDARQREIFIATYRPPNAKHALYFGDGATYEAALTAAQLQAGTQEPPKSYDDRFGTREPQFSDFGPRDRTIDEEEDPPF
jgi:hypothetical protein